MDRRTFMRSLGGAVAAALVPFVRPMNVPIEKPFGITNAFYTDGLLEELVKIKRARSLRGVPDGVIECWVPAGRAEEFKKLMEAYGEV